MDNKNTITWPGWETVRVIGRGSFGTVYEIRRDVAGYIERAALKHLSIPASEEELANLQSEGLDDESITKTFREQLNDILNEYKLMRKLNDCPYVVNCEDVMYVQKDDGFGWDILIKMELLKPFTELLRSQAVISEAHVIALAEDMSRALVRCEELSILHRDIKPQNIFISDDGKYKLGDFGIARAKERSSTGTARVGTYDYMAPEVYFGRHYDKSADIYSLGMVLYWLLNERRMPFLPQTSEAPRMQERDEARMRRLNGKKLPPPVNGSKELKRIVLKCCACRPEDRYAEANALLRDVLALQNMPVMDKGRNPRKTKQELHPKTGRKSSVLLRTLLTVWILATLVFSLWRLLGGLRASTDDMPISTAKTVITETAPSQETPLLTTVPTPAPTPDPRETQYIEAEVLLASGDKARAAIAFGKLGDYRDARERSFELWDVVAKRDTIATGAHTVGLKTSGRVTATGMKRDVSDWENVVAIAEASESHIVGLRADGTVVAAGSNEYGQSSVDDWQNIVAISAANSKNVHQAHTVGIRTDGTVVAIGSSDYAQCGVSRWKDIVAISAGELHTVGLMTGGTVVATGHNRYNQCMVSEWTDIVSISAGGFHTVGLKADGTVVATGYNNNGECNVSDWTNIVSIAAGHSFTVGLKADGTVVATIVDTPGENFGQCDVSRWQNIISITAGDHNTVGLKADGTIVAAGQNYNSQCDVSDWTNIKIPTAVQTTATPVPVNSQSSLIPEETPIPSTIYAQALRQEKETGISRSFTEKINIISSCYSSRIDASGTERDGRTDTGYSSEGYMNNKYGFYYADGELYYAEAREDDGTLQLFYWDGELIAVKDYRYGDPSMVAEGPVFERLKAEYAWLYKAATESVPSL